MQPSPISKYAQQLLVEVLASAPSGDAQVCVALPQRRETASVLVDHGLLLWAGSDHVQLTELGRPLARSYAQRMLDPVTARASLQ